MSHSGIIQRVPKTPDNIYGIKRIKSIPGDEVCVLYLGGNKTKSEHEASGNAKIIEQDILPHLSTKVPVYSAYYDVNIDNMWFDWGANYSKYGYNFLAEHDDDNFIWINEKNLRNVFNTKILPMIVDKTGKPLSVKTITAKLKKLHIIFDGYFYGLRNKMNQMLHDIFVNQGENSKDSLTIAKCIANNSLPAKDLDSKYIDDLFEHAIEPRISRAGRRISLNEAMARVRKINIVAHCHGTFIVQKLEEKMSVHMRNLGYNQTEIDQILSQMLVVAHAPIVPLGVSKFCMVSFTTARDLRAARPNNWVTKYVKHRLDQENEQGISTDWLQPCFLSGRDGNVFIIRNAFDPTPNGTPHSGEHRSARYVQINDQNDMGVFMAEIAGNILKNGIKNSLNETFTPLPQVDELVLGTEDREDMRDLFEIMKLNGIKFMADVYNFAITQRPKVRIKKPIFKTTELKR